MDKLSKHPLNPLFLAIALLAGSCLSFSYIAENWGGLEPCRLCLVQRYAYLSLVLVGVLGCVLKAKESFRKIALLVLSAGFLVSAYHSLAYFGFIQTRCTSQIRGIINESSFIQNLSTPITCSQKTLSFLGIPAPTANALFFLLGFWCAYKKRVIIDKTATNGD